MADRAAPAQRYTYLIGLLAFASGCVDAVTLMALGGAFTSVITGNLIFAGRAIGTTSLTPALDAITAIAGYVAGVAAGSRLAHVLGGSRPAPAWPVRATIVLGAEGAILVALNIAWIAYGARPPTAATYLMLGAAALSLGMQGAAARAISGAPSTTYMTGALTTYVEALVTGRRRTSDPSAAAGLLALVAGSALTAVLVEDARYFALVPPLAAVTLVTVIKLRHHRSEQRA
jgi:uncharacterized membrane protein YoaK (UPF0700 family)